MTPNYARRIAGLLRDHAAELRARADRIDALAKVPADITIDDIAAALLPPRSNAFSTIARVMIDAAREDRPAHEIDIGACEKTCVGCSESV